ncbi:probable cytochrome P450 9f2 isoform X2 [Bradysia coprophila]|uniref:probable cytochrome P450 9f2 isoform X2 n=1 Tax=Bradysia coprophila TaxID=38358 RepID=UPI00187DA8E6|nr:probable cytochrome P450 9f2 isoform X2 [Bradysia coprophila]
MLLFIVIVLLYSAYKWLTKNDDFFLKKGIPYEKPLPIVGNLLGLVLQRESFVDAVQRTYVKYKKSKIFGFFSFTQAGYMLSDPELIKSVLIRDFDHFVNHDQCFDYIDKMFCKTLFSLHNQQWREMRMILSPIFTSAKMKMMFDLLSHHVADFLIQFKRKVVADVDVYDLFSRYTADVTSTAVLGFEGDCVKNDNSEIYKIVKSMKEVFNTFSSLLKFLLLSFSKKLYAASGFQLVNKNVLDFLRIVTIDAMRDREKNDISRPDIIQLLLEVRKAKGHLSSQDEEINDDELQNFSAHKEFNVTTSKSTTSLDMNDDDLWVAQTFIFFLAGFHTTTHLLQTLTYELAKNQDVQQELYEEIQEVLTSVDGLRAYPPAVQIDRFCNKPINIALDNGKSIHITKGQAVAVPVYNVHHDPDYFPSPEKFDPTRFNDENKSSIVVGSYIPFGLGPRACLGSRFALMESKLLIFNLLANYKIETTKNTPKTLTFKSDLSSSVKEKIYLKFVARN